MLHKGSGVSLVFLYTSAVWMLGGPLLELMAELPLSDKHIGLHEIMSHRSQGH